MTKTDWTADPAFDAWVKTLPEKHWAKYDLSACRLGWEAKKAKRIAADESAVPTCWSLRHKDGAGALFADCMYGNEDDARNDAIALNGESGQLIPVPLFTHPPAQAVDVEAVREVIASIDLRAETYLDPQCKGWADKLSQAIGDKP